MKTQDKPQDAPQVQPRQDAVLRAVGDYLRQARRPRSARNGPGRNADGLAGQTTPKLPPGPARRLPKKNEKILLTGHNEAAKIPSVKDETCED